MISTKRLVIHEWDLHIPQHKWDQRSPEGTWCPCYRWIHEVEATRTLMETEKTLHLEQKPNNRLLGQYNKDCSSPCTYNSHSISGNPSIPKNSSSKTKFKSTYSNHLGRSHWTNIRVFLAHISGKQLDHQLISLLLDLIRCQFLFLTRMMKSNSTYSFPCCHPGRSVFHTTWSVQCDVLQLVVIIIVSDYRIDYFSIWNLRKNGWSIENVAIYLCFAVLYQGVIHQAHRKKQIQEIFERKTQNEQVSTFSIRSGSIWCKSAKASYCEFATRRNVRKDDGNERRWK